MLYVIYVICWHMSSWYDDEFDTGAKSLLAGDDKRLLYTVESLQSRHPWDPVQVAELGVANRYNQ